MSMRKSRWIQEGASTWQAGGRSQAGRPLRQPRSSSVALPGLMMTAGGLCISGRRSNVTMPPCDQPCPGQHPKMSHLAAARHGSAMLSSTGFPYILGLTMHAHQ